MSELQAVNIIYAGNSSASPQRDYIIYAGSSASDPRDYIIYYKLIISGLTGLVEVGSQLLEIQYFQWVVAGTIEAVSSAIQVLSANIDYINLRVSQINVISRNASLFRVTVQQHQLSEIEIGSGFLPDPIIFPVGDVGNLQAGLIEISSTELTFTVNNSIIVGSGNIKILRYPKILSHTVSRIYVGNLDLKFGDVFIAGQNATLTRTITKKHAVSIINVEGQNARLFSPYLFAIPSIISIRPTYSKLKFIPLGYLPALPPTRRTFTPPQYAIQKTKTIGGRKSKRLLCSRSVDAILELEYENIANEDAALVIDAYKSSFGVLYGFDLPSSILDGIEGELLEYLSMKNWNLKWYFENQPTTKSVSKGVSTLDVRLKARIDI